MLSFSRNGPDGNWPDVPVRAVIEKMSNVNIEKGLLLAVRNNRGVTVRGLFDGGRQERGLSQQYRKWSNALSLEWPRTSSLLEKIAQSFEMDARTHDEHAEQTEWEC